MANPKKTAKPRSGAAASRAPDLGSLAARVLAPARPALDAAREAVAGVSDPAEAWEALAARGVIPLDWVGDAYRAFAEDETPPALVPPTPGDRVGLTEVTNYLAQGPRLLDAHPPSLDACVTLASDPQGVVTAEAMALETVKALAPWGTPAPARVAWRCIAPASWNTQPGDWRHMPASSAAYAVYTRLGLREKTPRTAAYDVGTPRWRAAYAMDCDEIWRRAAAAGANGKVTRDVAAVVARLGHPPVPEALINRALAELPNPFEPLVSLWATGYALDVVTPEVVVLAAPRVDATPG